MFNRVLISIALACIITCDARSWGQQQPSPDWLADKRWAEQGNVWGGLGAAVGGAAGVFDRGELGHVFGDRDHNGYTFGNRGAADGFSEFARHAADGHIEGALEAGEQSTSDQENMVLSFNFTEDVFEAE
ncbi:hypothetical protein Tcan_02820 [Toxocara canis]|uniref:Uncharacterized protein n=1 Tax=Toxocara canis TaxID=6265 RepID=A0A0B2VZT5_TOXCA|nr:hypothetical protein Tcan_02820 [Toxocara canis]